MILFFGTRPGKKHSKQIQDVNCPFCKQASTLTLVTQSTYFHLFWIKLFKISTVSYVECHHCKKVYIEEEFNNEMRNALENIKLDK
ncbi:zinc-ribbon domain-containing protein [Maribacter sp. CXY002]|uniref:zinc-ribbon domain-containing protein n=1 Tax=Maribacter luteocoastalis TaxID=3407671 RepID=UPI003B68207A